MAQTEAPSLRIEGATTPAEESPSRREGASPRKRAQRATQGAGEGAGDSRGSREAIPNPVSQTLAVADSTRILAGLKFS